MVAPQGFEPRYYGPEPHVLPLDEGAKIKISGHESRVKSLSTRDPKPETRDCLFLP